MTTTELDPSRTGQTWSAEQLEAAWKLQRDAARAEGFASAETRRDRLDRLMAALTNSADELATAVSLDFGNRPKGLTLFAEIAVCVQDITQSKRSVERWMKKRRPGREYSRSVGIRAWIEPTPLGVVGVISPWNFPVVLAIQPVVAAIAAGNRVLLKMSEVTPHTAEAMRKAVAAYFSPEELLVISGGPDVGARFCALPLDHVLFTGGAPVGSKVAAAAGANLVPVTLELGGKNPTVVGRDADLERAAGRIARARLANSGQFCLSPDYVFVPREKEAQFLAAAEAAFRAAVPKVLDNPDYTAIVNDHHYERITGLIAEAVADGADIVEAVPAGERFPSPETRRIPPTLLSRVRPTMAITRDEVFGPVLTVLTYDSVDDVIRYVNDRPAPLAAYWYGDDTADFKSFKRNTRSGGVSRNAFAVHAAVGGLPFGGVGRSGTGYYHGRFGFDTFSHLRAVAESPTLYNPVAIFSPPYSPRLEPALKWLFARLASRVNRRIDKTASH